MNAVNHLEHLTEETDEQKIGSCAPIFRDTVRFVLRESQRMLDGVDPGRFLVRIACTDRSHDEQWRAYSKGRWKNKDGSWKVVDPARIVTYATPFDSAHCVLSPSEKPWALAADLWILHRDSGVLLASTPKLHPAWSVVPFAAYTAQQEVVIGAGFKAIKGGDWPHFELADWQHRVSKGKFIP